MSHLTVFFLCIAIITACVSAMFIDFTSSKTYGWSLDNTEILVIKDRAIERKMTLSFNEDRKYDLVIHKIELITLNGLVKPELMKGGPKDPYFVLDLTPKPGFTPWIGVTIYGKMNKGERYDISYYDVKWSDPAGGNVKPEGLGSDVESGPNSGPEGDKVRPEDVALIKALRKWVCSISKCEA